MGGILKIATKTKECFNVKYISTNSLENLFLDLNKLLNEKKCNELIENKKISRYKDALLFPEDYGLIIIANVLWHGDVVDKTKNDKLTNIIRDFNSYVKNDKKTEQIILPLGDGFTVCRKL